MTSWKPLLNMTSALFGLIVVVSTTDRKYCCADTLPMEYFDSTRKRINEKCKNTLAKLEKGGQEYPNISLAFPHK